MSSEDLLLVGRVARAHGNRGQVIVNPDTDFPEARFRPGAELLVGSEPPVPRRILEVRFQQGRPIVALEGIATMDEAEALAGAELWIHAAAAGALPDGTFYRHDLVGCEVTDRAGTAIGQVARVEGTRERSLLAIDGPRGEILIPLTAGICVSIEPAARRIVVDPPEGLVALNERS